MAGRLVGMGAFILLPIYLLVAAFSRVTLVPDTGLEFVLVGVLVAWMLLCVFAASGSGERLDKRQYRFFAGTLYRAAYRKAIKAGASPDEADAVARRAVVDANLSVGGRS